MDWRSYFCISPSTELALEKELKLEKHNPYHDAKGRFARKGAGGAKRVNLANVQKPFDELSIQEQMRLVKSAIASSGKSPSTSKIMFAMSQITGQHPGEKMAGAVGNALQQLQKIKQIKISLTEHTVRDKQGNLVLLPENKRVLKTDRAGNISIDLEASAKKTQSYTISLTNVGSRTADKFTLQHTGEITRPAKYEHDKDSLHGKLLAARAKEFPGGESRAATMGRFFSKDPNAPENTHKITLEIVNKSQALAKKAKANLDNAVISGDKAAIAKANQEYKNIAHRAAVDKAIYTSDQVNRHTFYRNSQFYDATSSVNGIIGTMVGNKQMLQNSRLQSFGPEKHPHADTLSKLGVKPENAHKPYFANTMMNAKTGKAMTADDFKGFGSAYGNDKGKMADAMKEISKKIFTPGTYGSNIHGGEFTAKDGKRYLVSGGAKEAAKLLRASGMSHDDAHKAAQKMAENFQASPMHAFNGAFRGIIKQAPEGFVYKNPMSGFNMTFDKYKATTGITTAQGTRSQIPLRVSPRLEIDGKQTQISIPYVKNERDTGKTNSGAAALFIQNWDAAVIANIGNQVKSAKTLHDAIAVQKGARAKKDLMKAVSDSYNKIARIKPIDNLVKQMKAYTINRFRQEHPNMTKAERKKLVAHIRAINYARQNFYSAMGNNSSIVNVPPDNTHFVEE